MRHDLAGKVGSLLLIGIDGASLAPSLASTLTRQIPAGIVLFSRNIRNRAQLADLISSIKSPAPEAFVAVDQEGGRVARLEAGFPCYPSPGYYGARSDAEGMLHAVKSTAEELRGLGINLNLIPVCDLAPSRTDHVIHSRSYSSDPEELAEMVARQVHTLAECGIFSCAKHFPGLASAVGDPHTSAAVSRQAAADFRSRDYLPFKAAIDAGAPMVMVSHINAENLDSEYPATFSRKIIEGELRDRLGFSGLVVADDLHMGAISGKVDPDAAAVSALKAGCDLLIYGNLESEINELVISICRRGETDPELSARIEGSATRLEACKRDQGARL